jgi:hypothetical protein
MKHLNATLLILFCSASAPALANPLTCTLGDLARRIEVVYSDPGQPVPCEVIYDKSGEGSFETLWRAYNQAGYCEDRAAELAEKLTRLGWSCSSDRARDLDPDPAPEI